MKPNANFPTTEGPQYIEEMASKLAEMAREEGSEVLATILDMAALEAKNSREATCAKLQ